MHIDFRKRQGQVAKELIERSHQPALLAEKFHMTSSVLNGDLLGQEFSKFDALLDSEMRDLLQEFKNLYAHELQDGGNITVLTFMLKKAVAFKKKKLGLAPLSDNALPPMPKKVRRASRQVAGENKSAAKIAPQRKQLKTSVKKYVWKRANGCCEHYNAKVGMRCSSKFALQPDHIIPLALGGTDEISNLQLLCRVHNSRRAIKTFGIPKF